MEEQVSIAEFKQKYEVARGLFKIFKDKIDLNELPINESKYDSEKLYHYLFHDCSMNENINHYFILFLYKMIILILLIIGLVYIGLQEKKKSTRNVILVVICLIAFCMSKEGFTLEYAITDGESDGRNGSMIGWPGQNQGTSPRAGTGEAATGGYPLITDGTTKFFFYFPKLFNTSDPSGAPIVIDSSGLSSGARGGGQVNCKVNEVPGVVAFNPSKSGASWTDPDGQSLITEYISCSVDPPQDFGADGSGTAVLQDLATGGPLIVDGTVVTATCAANESVSGNVCQACPAGTTRPAGDDPSGSDTSCTTTVVTATCAANESVIGNTCVACPPGTTRPAGDDPSSADTTCFAADGYNPFSGAACTTDSDCLNAATSRPGCVWSGDAGTFTCTVDSSGGGGGGGGAGGTAQQTCGTPDAFNRTVMVKDLLCGSGLHYNPAAASTTFSGDLFPAQSGVHSAVQSDYISKCCVADIGGPAVPIALTAAGDPVLDAHGNTVAAGAVLCSSTAAPADNSTNCGDWARGGECIRNPVYMLSQCATSCQCRQGQIYSPASSSIPYVGPLGGPDYTNKCCWTPPTPGQEGCSVVKGDPLEEGAENTTCNLFSADPDADPPVTGSCVRGSGSGSCTYVAAASAGSGTGSGYPALFFFILLVVGVAAVVYFWPELKELMA